MFCVLFQLISINCFVNDFPLIFFRWHMHVWVAIFIRQTLKQYKLNKRLGILLLQMEW